MNSVSRWIVSGVVAVLWVLAPCRGESVSAAPIAGEAAGRVLVREGGAGPYRGRAAEGMELHAGDAVLTGPGGRVEWRIGERGRWRIGERAVWVAGAAFGDAELRAGTAIAAVPDGARWTVGAARARVSLGEGVWLLSAVENEGLKLVALDAGEAAIVDAEPAETRTKKEGVSRLRLRAGEVVFVRPEGGGFGPVVTIFLDELLASSRLVAQFKEPLPQMERLRQQGEAQRERLRLVGNVHVGGAKDAEGFQLIVPGKVEEKAGAPK